jgi:hypothetical protein
MADYRRKLAEYNAVREPFEATASAYWTTISEKRRARFAKRRNGETITAEDYVLTQPPVYSGPPKPADPSPPEKQPRPRAPLPVVADFLSQAQEHLGSARANPRPRSTTSVPMRAWLRASA